jgi:hypothetical protein
LGPCLRRDDARRDELPFPRDEILHPPSPARTIAFTVLLWAAISALGALQTYSDNLRVGVDSHYPALLVTWFIEYACR